MGTKKTTKACNVKTDAESTREFKIEVTFDFEGVTDEDILAYATSHLMIGRAQAKFRTMTESELEKLETYGYLVKVAESGRLPADPTKATKKAFEKIEDKAAKLALIKELQESLND